MTLIGFSQADFLHTVLELTLKTLTKWQKYRLEIPQCALIIKLKSLLHHDFYRSVPVAVSKTKSGQLQ